VREREGEREREKVEIMKEEIEGRLCVI